MRKEERRGEERREESKGKEKRSSDGIRRS